MKKSRILLSIFLAAVFLASTGMIGLRVYQHQASNLSQQTAELLFKPISTEPATPPQPPTVPAEPSDPTEPTEPPPIPDPIAAELAQTDLAALQAVNPDVLGWIYIPGTIISYPLLQGEDNNYYLNYTWDYQPSYRGSIYLDCKNSPDLTDYNTIIFGHNLLDDTMFSDLHKYKDPEFWKSQPHIYLVTADGIHRYRIYAAFEVPTNVIAYRLRFDDTQKQEFIDSGLAWSIHDAGVTPTVEDRFLTLSTCTGVIKSNRWVIQAYREGFVVPRPLIPPDNASPQDWRYFLVFGAE